MVSVRSSYVGDGPRERTTKSCWSFEEDEEVEKEEVVVVSGCWAFGSVGSGSSAKSSSCVGSEVESMSSESFRSSARARGVDGVDDFDDGEASRS